MTDFADTAEKIITEKLDHLSGGDQDIVMEISEISYDVGSFVVASLLVKLAEDDPEGDFSGLDDVSRAKILTLTQDIVQAVREASRFDLDTFITPTDLDEAWEWSKDNNN